MKKIIASSFLFFLCISNGYSQSTKYIFSIENVTDAATGKHVLGDYLYSFFNSGENKVINSNFSEQTQLFIIECRLEVSEEQLSEYLTTKHGLTLIDFRVSE